MNASDTVADMDKTFRHKREQKTESQNLKKEPKKLKTELQNLTPKHIMVFPLKLILKLCERSLNPGGDVL